MKLKPTNIETTRDRIKVQKLTKRIEELEEALDETDNIVKSILRALHANGIIQIKGWDCPKDNIN